MFRVLYPLWEESDDKIPGTQRKFWRVREWMFIGFASSMADAKKRYPWTPPVLEQVKDEA
jgi:hypothetical protein